MPYVRGFLKLGRRDRPDRPERPVDPDYGIDEGGNEGIWPGLPDIDPPEPPPGIWPPLTPEHPWRPIDPGWGQGRPLPPTVGGGPARPPGLPSRPGGGPARPERPTDPGFGVEEGGPPEVGGGPVLPPGTIWPPLPPGVHGKFLALVLIAGSGYGAKYRYVVVDADARPWPGRPDNTLPDEPEPEQPA